MDQATVDRLVGNGRSVEDVYPLTPMQAGMVFHDLSHGDQEVYLQQMAFVLEGVPDPHLLGAAWQHVVWIVFDFFLTFFPPREGRSPSA